MTSFFDSAVNTYEAAAQPQRLAARRLVWEATRHISIESISASGRFPHCVIDLGCGTGLAVRSWFDLLQAEALPLPGEVLLVDQAPAMVARALTLMDPQAGVLQGVVADVFDCEVVDILSPLMPSDSSKSRLILSSYVLQWSPMPLMTLKSVWAKLLRPGDWLAFVVPDSRSFGLFRSALDAAKLSSHFLELPDSSELIGVAAQKFLSTHFRCVGSGTFSNEVSVISANDYLRHFTRIGAQAWRYKRAELVKLNHCLDYVLKSESSRMLLDYFSTWMLLQRG